MKTKILILLSIIIAIIFIGGIKVEAYSSVSKVEDLANALGDATYSEDVVKLEKDVQLTGEEIFIHSSISDLTLDLNGFSINGIYFSVFSDLHVKNGMIKGEIMYWGNLTVEDATIRHLNGQAESFTNVKGTSTLNGITLGNLIIENDATLVIDENDFEFGYHDYNENGHLCTNNGTIIIKDADSEFEIEAGNNILNNGNIINNGSYINNANTVYEIIIPNLDSCEITSNTRIASKGEIIELTVEPKAGYVLQSVLAYKSTDKNIVVQMENNSFLMPDYNVSINVDAEAIKRIDNVEITGATIPKVGNVPVISGLKVPDSAQYKIVNAVWGTWSNEIGPLDSFEPIKINDKFIKGKTYALQVTLHSLDRYTSFENADGIINGIKCTGLIGYIDCESVCLDKAVYYLTFNELIENYFLNNTDNQKYIYSDSNPLVFEIDISSSAIAEISIDGKLLNGKGLIVDQNFIDTTKITLSDEFVKSLSFGLHTIKFVFNNGSEAETTFTILDSSKTDDEDNIIETEKNNNKNDELTNNTIKNAENKETNDKINNPQTGDNILLFIGILAISVIGIFVTRKLFID